MSTKVQKFGGRWTQVKLERVDSYHSFFIQEVGERYRTYYVDAFAGTGTVELPTWKGSFFKIDPHIDGSARRALQLDTPYGRYVFVDENESFCEKLRLLQCDFPHLRNRIRVRRREANEYLVAFCGKINWKTSRAVFFLDPYGMQVNWKAIEAIAATKAADMWYLFPLGTVNRLLKRDGEKIADAQRKTLDRVFGTSAWFKRFYRSVNTGGFFPRQKTIKKADDVTISRYFVERLKNAFPWVAEKPLGLFNKRGSPLFLLCFASARCEGQEALCVADTILSVPSTAYQFLSRLQERLSSRKSSRTDEAGWT